MKKTAFFLFMIFAAVQVVPAVKAVLSDTYSVFIADEEKGGDNGNSNDNKAKHYFTVLASTTFKPDTQLDTAFQLAEKIKPSPCLEKSTPPPNFC